MIIIENQIRLKTENCRTAFQQENINLLVHKSAFSMIFQGNNARKCIRSSVSLIV